MAKYVIKDLSAKQIEQVLVTTYHALSKPLLIYPSLDVLKIHVELKLDTSIDIYKLKQISSADGNVIIPYEECHIGDSLFVLNGTQLDEYKLARKNSSVDLPIIGTDETNGFLYLICSTSLSITDGVALNSNTFAFPAELQEVAGIYQNRTKGNFLNFLKKLEELINNGTLLRNTTYYGGAYWEAEYMPIVYPYGYSDAEHTNLIHLTNAELTVHILYDYGVNLEMTSFSGSDKAARTWMMSLRKDCLHTVMPDAYHWTGTAEVGRLICN